MGRLVVGSSVIFTLVCFGYLAFNTVYEETLGQNQVTVEIEDTRFRDLIFTDQGTFTFLRNPPRLLRRIRPLRDMRWRFWHDLGDAVQSQLIMGCTYDVITMNSYFDDHKLGVNRAPAQTKIIKVIRRLEPNERLCDISDRSGKPVCTDAQIIETPRGHKTKAKDCNFERYLIKKYE